MLAATTSLTQNPTLGQVLESHPIPTLLAIGLVVGLTFFLMFLYIRAMARLELPVTAALPSPVLVASSRKPANEAEIVAVIAAAAALFRRPRESKAAPVGPAQWMGTWAIEGRFQHFRSHRPR
ncbi:MAG: hypothetical protein ACYDC1_11045 [Limisphaerales bacterium]